ncbi:hypothetical protein [Glycomyces buryatensis]|uniref:Uncharacterized protein n=1 Tax=Glycomyces buryatensis TaxID=2570927 RepID=A0A4S8QHK3_9ACTN|nr:hypothetical protein [Glycomyces buryatensis]THV42712.1 hypothetical protein FAB82_04825 [Glycomyces buryatensis]
MINRALTATAVLAALAVLQLAHWARKFTDSPRALVVTICLAYSACGALMLLAMPHKIETAWSWAKATVTTAWSAVWQLIS